MIPWIQVYSNLITHPKTSKLADLLKLSSKATVPNVVATGLLISLWTWAVQNAYSGDLSGCSDRAIADAARYRQSPQGFVNALTEAGWLDHDRKLHDWGHYAALLIEQEDNRRAKTNERVKRYRNKRKNEESAHGNASKLPPAVKQEVDTSVTCNAPVTVTGNGSNASTLPNHTIHNNITTHTHNTTLGTEALHGEHCECFDSQSFSLFWETYPAKYGVKDGREAAWIAWRKLAPSKEQAEMIIRNLKAWKISGEWTGNGGRYIPKAADFLSKKTYWGAAPSPCKDYAIPKGASGELGEAELEAIRRVLREEGGSQNVGTS